MSNRQRALAVGLLSWLWVAAVPSGQTTPPTSSTAAVVEGIVVDSGSGPLLGVTVTLEQPDQIPPPAILTRVTDTQGRFRFEGVRAGTYRVTARLAGFKTMVLGSVRVSGATLSLRFVMLPGEPAETVTVSQHQVAVDHVKGVARSGINVTLDGVAAGRAGGATDQFFARGARQIIGVPNTESYARIESNPFRLTSAEPLSTFAVDVDTASYTNVRRFLNEGRLPPVDAVRVEELVNYFRYAYPEPDDGRPVSITTEVGDAPWAPGHKLVLVGVRARPIDDRRVAGRNIVLLIDVSGSMAAPNKLPLLQSALRMFADSLRDQDRIAIVVYAGHSGLALPSTPARNRERIHDAIQHLRAGGSTNGAAGIQLAYEVARSEFIPGGVNRVVLATDGDFNVGVSSDSELVRLIERERESGVFLSVLGVGTGNLKDSKMEGLADKGNGHYAYLDSLLEARRVLVREGGATLETVAKDVKFQVEFNPSTVAAWKLIGYENRLLPHEAFNDDTKDGGELGAGHTVTGLYEIVPAGMPLPAELRTGDGSAVVDPLIYQGERRPGRISDDLLTVKIRYKAPEAAASELMTRPVRAAGGTASALPFACAVAEFGLLLRDPGAARPRWTALVDRLGRMPASSIDAGDRQQFAELVELAAGLSGMVGRR